MSHHHCGKDELQRNNDTVSLSGLDLQIYALYLAFLHMLYCKDVCPTIVTLLGEVIHLMIVITIFFLYLHCILPFRLDLQTNALYLAFIHMLYCKDFCPTIVTLLREVIH